MGKHNGKARRTGLPVGKSLEKQNRRDQKPVNSSHASAKEQSILEPDNVDDIMAMAELAGRDFSAQRQQIVVLDSNLASVSKQLSVEELQSLQMKYSDLVKIPRRPPWSVNQSPEELDRNERQGFLDWRRNLARLHEAEPDLYITPYEKNLEVWRQLWRVLERSHVIVQVVDARNPLLYYSEDLAAYGREINPQMELMVLLNKSDLVPEDVREEWADYFESKGIKFAFWSAIKGGDDPTAGSNGRTAIKSADEIVQYLSSVAEEIHLSDLQVKGSPEDGSNKTSYVVFGLVGYPNVGKSSTINALYGRKKTPVAATPGKTKHFQTLILKDDLCLCDCPGLVLPRFSNSKAEMVVAGIIPVDRLMDVVSPVALILEKIGISRFCEVYKLQKLEKRLVNSSAVEVMSALAISRGWFQAAGRSDMTKTGRQIIKDFCSGVLIHCERLRSNHCHGLQEPDQELKIREEVTDATGLENSMDRADIKQVPEKRSEYQKQNVDGVKEISGNDIDDLIMKEIVLGEPEILKSNPNRRPDYKFHKKPPRRKGNRGRQYNTDAPAMSSAYIKGNRGSLTNGLLKN